MIKKNAKEKILIGLLLIIAACIVFGICANWNTYIYANRLTKAIQVNNVKKVEKLLENEHGDVNCKAYRFENLRIRLDLETPYPLEAACKTGNYGIVKMLIKREVDPNLYGGEWWFHALNYNGPIGLDK